MLAFLELQVAFQMEVSGQRCAGLFTVFAPGAWILGGIGAQMLGYAIMNWRGRRVQVILRELLIALDERNATN
jgi:hypothetical protein